jgi:Tol biopolymer transport system component
MPDGGEIIASVLGSSGSYVLDRIKVATGLRIHLTQTFGISERGPGIPGGDIVPRVSRNGASIAFSRASNTAAELMLIPAAGGDPVRLAPGFMIVGGIGWTADGDVIFCAKVKRGFSTQLFRVRPSGGEPKTVPFTSPGMDIEGISISASGKSMAYLMRIARASLWRYTLLGPSAARKAPQLVAHSARIDVSPDFAPDGQRFAFTSTRDGDARIYVARFDDRQPTRLTSPDSGSSGWPRWSPDGRKIVFDGRVGEFAQIYIVDADGGRSQQLTHDAISAKTPQWSSDGQWIYYTRGAAEGRGEIWRIRPSGADNTRVASGQYGFPSPDGKRLYYGKPQLTGIYSQDMNGGPEVLEAPDAPSHLIAVAPSGFYFVSGVHGSSGELMYFNYARRSLTAVAAIEKPHLENPGLAISADEASALVAQYEGTISQVMLARNFE